MAIPLNIFDTYMGSGYDQLNDRVNAQRLAAYAEMQRNNSQNLRAALGLQNAYQHPNPVNPEPNPVLLLLE
jgi:prephenate dehydrogenase